MYPAYDLHDKYMRGNNHSFPCRRRRRRRRLYTLQRVITVGQHVRSFTIGLLWSGTAKVIRSAIRYYYAAPSN